MRILSPFFALVLLIFLAASPLYAAKVDSINGGTVTIFLESMDDEDVEEGQTAYLVNSSGERKVTLFVLKNRGTFADMKVVQGSPAKSYKVLMPHEVEKAAAPVVEKKKT